MSTTSTTSTIWVAYGAEGNVVGTIRKADDTYTVTMAGASEALGSYPTMDIAKNALHAHMRAGSPRPQFREH
ncbi:methyltransferase [Microbacterium sp.]|uniref:methyltransferase n=1 Tax=Microbacterium sp. TaxID=51671 RepID=UPI003A848087